MIRIDAVWLSTGPLDMRAGIDSALARVIKVFGAAYISQLYGVEREVKQLSGDERLQIRQAKSKPLVRAFHQWMLLQRQKITDGSATAKALDYSLKRWGALTRFLDDGQLPIDNNWIENQVRPIAIGRSNWMFAGSLGAGQRAAVMSLIQSAKLNGHDPYAYIQDALTRLPTQKNSQIEELLPHRWQPTKTYRRLLATKATDQSSCVAHALTDHEQLVGLRRKQEQKILQ